MQVRAAVVREPRGPFTIESLELGDPHADELVIDVAGAGVCHTDMTCRDQLYPVEFPIVLGHEGAGVVVEIGDAVSGFEVGDHVVMSYMSCGACRNCGGGDPSRCIEIFPQNFGGARADGSHALRDGGDIIHDRFFGQSSFANRAICSTTNAVKIPNDVPLESLGPLGCGIQSGAGAVMNALKAEAGSSIAVFGCGSVGLSAIMAAHVNGCAKIIAVDLNPARLSLAEELGATHAINPSADEPVAAIQMLTGDGADYSVECVGLPAVFRQSIDSLTVSGTACLVGAAPLGTEATIDMNSIMFGRTVTGAIEGAAIPQEFIPRLVALYQEGRFPIDRLITTYPLDEINSAFADMDAGRAIKPVLLP